MTTSTNASRAVLKVQKINKNRFVLNGHVPAEIVKGFSRFGTAVKVGHYKLELHLDLDNTSLFDLVDENGTQYIDFRGEFGISSAAAKYTQVVVPEFSDMFDALKMYDQTFSKTSTTWVPKPNMPYELFQKWSAWKHQNLESIQLWLEVVPFDKNNYNVKLNVGTQMYEVSLEDVVPRYFANTHDADVTMATVDKTILFRIKAGESELHSNAYNSKVVGSNPKMVNLYVKWVLEEIEYMLGD